MPRTRRIYRPTCTTVACVNALNCTILIGLLCCVWLTLIHVPPVSAKLPTINDLPTLRGAWPGSNDDEHSVKSHPTRLLVRFVPSTSRALEDTIHLRAGANVLKRYRSVEGLSLVEVPESQRENARKRYAADPQVLYAQDNHVIHIAAVPNDPGFSLQWGLQNTGQTVDDIALGGDDPGTPGADIRAEGAWNLTTGNAAFRIAVLDTGVDYNHPDLAANIWTNPGEIPGNGIDDDGNGWIDDVHGYDFANDDGDPMDDHSHGTHVAGILGAVANNGVGVAGVNWQCQIVALKFMDSTGTGFESDAIDAMDYLIANGILLSNNSWGNDAEFSQALSDAVEGLQSIGHLFVVAAGNIFGRNIDVIPQYPASFDFPHLITVAGVDNDDVLSVFSNTGPLSVDLAAPGDNVWSTLPNGSYGFATGTSMATPHVTGTAALLWGRRPELSWSDVRSRLLRSVRVVPTLIGRTVTGGIIDASVAVGDCNHNGVPDEEDIAQGGSDDCNGDGFPDECEPDCNGTGLADACDIATGVSEDCNGNAVPDECELAVGSSEDCNGNAVPDECDLLSGGSEDLNGSGAPDECESCSVATDCDDANDCTDDSCADALCYWIDHTGACDDGDACTIGDACQSGVCVGDPAPNSECLPVLSMVAVAINGDEISGGPLSEVTLTRGDRLTIEMFLRNWSPRRLAGFDMVIDPSGYTSGTTGSLSPVVDPTPDTGMFVEIERPDFAFFGQTTLVINDNMDPSFYQYIVVNLFDENCVADAGGSAYLGTLILDIGETASGTFQMCLNEDEFFTDLVECSLIHIRPTLFECLTIAVPLDDCTTGEDCNGNGSWDICDINDETSEDCNGNDVPDECDIDCNGNGLPDECDIDSGFSEDCDADGVPNECDESCLLFLGADYATGDLPFSVAIGDLDGDQVPDLAVTNRGDDNISVLLGLGDGTFVTAVNYTVGDSPFSVVIGDLDGDQVPDLAAANAFGDDVSVLLGLGDGTFADAVNYAAGDSPRSVAIRDLDGDQVPDLAVTNGSSDNVSVLLGVGDGTFAAAVNYAAGDSPQTVAISDLDGDQAPDLTMANEQSHDVSVLLGVGDGTFAAAVQYAVGFGPTSVAVGDLDGDQVPDLTVANSGSDNVSVLLGFGDGTFAFAVHYAAGENARSIAIGDLDGDQVPDLAVANERSDNVSVLRGFGDGTFDAAVHYAAGGGPVSIAIGDLDGNLVLDLAVANFRSDNVTILLNQSSSDCNGNGIPDECDIDCGPPGGACDLPGCGLTVDCNGNGLADECEADCNGNGIPDDCDVDPNDPDGNSFVSDDCNGNGLPDECDPFEDCNVNGIQDICDIAGGVSADCNGNARPDECDIIFAFSEDCNGNGVPDECVGTDEADCNGNGLPDECDIDSGFSDDCNRNGVPDECDGSDLQFLGANYAAGDLPQSVAIGDLNGDQVPDLAVANVFSNNVSVLLGVGDGTFVTRVDYAAGVRAISVAIGDLDGDQVFDLAVANQLSADISVLLGVGDGTFAPAVNYTAGDQPSSVAIGDLNGDQIPDLAGTNFISDDVSVLLGVGDGTFTAAVHYAADSRPASIVIGDLDGDQAPDLAMANFNGFNVSVLLGVGDGTFADAVHYTAGFGPTSVAIGDLDGDLVPDLAVANWLDRNISVLLGIGDGTFAAAVQYAAGIQRPGSVAIGDLSGDQVLDLAVADYDGDRVLILPGIGDGTFAVEAVFATGNMPISVVIGDLNGDGAPDLAVVNGGSDDVSVLLNQSPGGCNGNCLPDECDIDCGPPGGACDLPGCGQSADCNGNGRPDECDTAICGDGCLMGSEACDEGPNNSDTEPDTCRTTCVLPSCGDGVVDTGEVCDDGVNNSDTEPDACRTTCVLPSCGDRVVDTGEACDDGLNNSDTEPDTCRTTCVLPSCGDRVVDTGEACDDGVNNSDTEPDACRTTCVLPSCGDRVVDTGEACDAGVNNSDTEPDACRTNCAQAGCGDGVVDTGEECDDGNTEPGDDCDENCLFEPGACCLGTACTIGTESDCLDSGGTFFGPNSTCNAPDADGDGLRDECDGCPDDSNKIEPGICGCGVDDSADSDNDGVPDCDDLCPGVDDGVFGDCTGTIPTVSVWGLLILALLLLAGSKVVFRGRSRRYRFP